MHGQWLELIVLSGDRSVYVRWILAHVHRALGHFDDADIRIDLGRLGRVVFPCDRLRRIFPLPFANARLIA